MKHITKILLALVLLLAGTLIVLLSAQQANAATITVDDDGPANYSKIQHAIDNATEGDTILVKEGTYYENISINKSINLQGAGADKTIIDNEGENDVVSIKADWVNFSGFRVVNGNGSTYNSGIKVRANNCTISENHCLNASYGIEYKGNGANIINNVCKKNRDYGIELLCISGTIMGNTCLNTHYCDGILVVKSSNIIVEANTCMDSGSSGLSLWKSNDIIVRNNSCRNNDRGIDIYKTQCHVENNELLNNNHFNIRLSNCSNSSFIENICGYSDIGIQLFIGNSCFFERNALWSNNIGLIASYGSTNITAHNNLIYNNTQYGINATENNGFTINATHNWWGHTSGPYHPTGNPEGKGDNITDFVIFEPWLKVPENYDYAVPVIESMVPNPALISETINFIASVEGNKTVERYAWRSSLDKDIYNGTDAEFRRGDLPAGMHTIYLRVLDTRGIWSPETEAALVVHRKPTASNISITPSISVEGSPVTFIGSGTDDGTIERYSWRNSIDDEFYNGTEAEFDYSGLSVGEHTVFLKVMDNYGVWSEEVNTTLIIHEKPVASIISINPDPALDTDTIAFIGNGTDDGSITRYIWRTDEQILYNGTNSSFGCSNLSVGTHTIYLKVLDDLGAWSEEVNATLTIIALNKIPTVLITFPNDGDKLKGTVTISGTASDEDGTVEKVEISIKGGPWLPATGTESWSLEWNTEKVKNGDYTITVRSYDGKNYSLEKPITVKVENKEKNGGDGIIPGFEAVVAAAAVGAALLIYRRKRR